MSGKTMGQKMKKKNKKISYRKNLKKGKRVNELIYQWEVTPQLKQRSSLMLLNYDGKVDVHDLLQSIPEASLRESNSYGQITFDNTNNALIYGDNIAVLKHFMNDPKVNGKVKLVYIDPPFSTRQIFRRGSNRTATISASDNDEIAYIDHLAGAEFLEFLRQRIILIRELLSDDGSIYVHIDSKMEHYLKVLMDEIFGREHFINDITRIKCNPKNFSRKGYGNIKDTILFYSKTNQYIWNEPHQEMTEEEINRLFPKIDKNGRRYTTTPLHAPGETKNGATGKEWNGLFPPHGRHWRISPKELTRLEKSGLIEWSSSGNPRKKIFADEVLSRGKKIQDVWELKDPQYPTYPTEKNLDLIKRIIEASSNPGDIIMDCFAGSGTTLMAAELLKRKWIGIDNSKIAISTAIKKIKEISNVSSFTLFSCNEKKRQ
ncbi:MAG: site-specific DNA-methyltransferase [Bacteroidota bacterium]|nr:site-specific DNA-methyltransferase [Bacteroidota bacterium]